MPYIHPALKSCVIVALCLVPACSRPTVESITMQVREIDLNRVDLDFDVTVSNPMPLDLAVPSGGYKVEVAGKKFIKSQDVPAVDLPSGGVARMRLPASLDYVKVLRIANKLRGKGEIPYELEGHLVVPIAGQEIKIPFSHKGTAPMMQLPIVEVLGAQLTGSMLGIDARVTNPNQFPIDLADLGYDVQVADDTVQASADSAGSVEPGQSRKVRLSGNVAQPGAVRRVLRSKASEVVQVGPTGRLRTPYGEVAVDGQKRSRPVRARGRRR